MRVLHRLGFTLIATFVAPLVALVVLTHIVHALTLDRIIEYREISMQSPRWPEALDGYRIAFIADVHTTPDAILQGIVGELNARGIDMLLLGGDFSIAGGRYRAAIAVLSQVQTTDGIFGVEGNHDNYIRLFAAMEHYGVVPLSNSGLAVRDGFFLAGVEDMRRRNSCIATATAAAQNDDFVLLVSHNPDLTMRQDTTGVDLILSGHTHGGHITFFGLWAPYLTLRNSITDYGQRFASGWARSRDGVPVYVNTGTGRYYGIPRVFARPQVTLLTLHSGGTACRTSEDKSFWSNGYVIIALLLLIWAGGYWVCRPRTMINHRFLSRLLLSVCRRGKPLV
ncbi:MAG: metallophosphoesterase [Spirochaetes bacterium]|nr:metallophosphoesterase [Spirochaetota bacterium]